MSIDEVLTQIRLYIGRHPEPYTHWADAIRAEIEDKAWMKYEVRRLERMCEYWRDKAKDQHAEIERMKANRVRGEKDYCALMERYDAQHNEIERLHERVNSAADRLRVALGMAPRNRP